MFKRLIVGFALLATLATWINASSWASPSEQVTLQTSKAPGPGQPGTFEATGAFADSGAIDNLAFNFSAIGAPTFVISHLTILFTGAEGAFTLKTQITETLTSDPNVLTDSGTWTIIGGTGAYADLHGQGTIVGTLDENAGLINRTFTGNVHFD
jgi:hypothetical protein